MKKKRLLIFGVLAALAVAYIASAVPNFRHRAEWNRTVAQLRSLPLDRLTTAIQTFVRDRKTTDSAVPLRELMSGGYLRAEEVGGLADRDVSVSLVAD